MSNGPFISREESGRYDAPDDEVYMFQRIHPVLKAVILAFDVLIVVGLVGIARYILV